MASETPSSGAGTPGKRMRLVVLLAGALVIAGGFAFWLASRAAQRGGPETADGAVSVTVTRNACEPDELVVPAGRVTFRIVNASDRAVEWEILDGVMVVDERENIAPGFVQTLTSKLAPGTYAITCGLLSNPRGTLRVTPSAASEAAGGPDPVAFIGALAEYKVFLAMEAAALEAASRRLADALRAGDLERAKVLWVEARAPYKRMQPVVGRIADLDAAIDGRTEFWEQREEDPRFTGFHRIELALFARGTTDGLESIADRLETDVVALRQRIRETRLAPAALPAGAARVLRQIADEKISGDDDRWSHAELADFQATLEGCRKIVDLLRPVVAPTDGPLVQRIEDRFTAVQETLARFRSEDGLVGYDRLGPEARDEIARDMRALADEIAHLDDDPGRS